MKKLTALLFLSFLAAVSVRADLIWYDGFQYPNGAIITNTIIGPGTNSIWIRMSGSANPSDMLVENSNLQVCATGGSIISRQDDCQRYLSVTNGSSYTNQVQTLYASFTVICTSMISNGAGLPNGNGTYFASFYSGPVYNYTAGGRTTNFAGWGYCGRIQAFTNFTVLPNTWRLGVTDNSLSTNKADGGFPVDLALNTPYQVVEELDPIHVGGATIWVNPININNTGANPIDPAYTASDPMGFATTTNVNCYAFRQPSTFGNAFFLITNCAIATTFAEAMTNIWTTNAVAPTIVYQPVGVTNYVGASISVSAVANGQGLANMTYQWQKNGNNYTTGNSFNIASAQTTDSGNYTLIATTPYGLSATSSVATVLITAVPVPPSFVNEPVSQTLYKGQSVIFSTTVISPGNVTFTWYSNNVVITRGQNDSGDTSTFEIDNLTTNASALYKVAVTNNVAANGIVSTNAVLTVINPQQVTIAYLRTLVDPITYQPTNVPPSIPYQVTGIVTTFTNLTTGNTSSYYLQDGTAGIDIFATLASTFRPAEGDVITFVGVLSSYTSGLELYADPSGSYPYTSYTDLSNNIAALPAPMAIPYNVMNNPSNANYHLGGLLVQISDVHFGARAGTATSTTANDYVAVTNSAGQTFYLMFPDLDLDVAGKTLPSYANTVSGILYSANSVVTNTILVTRFSDIASPVPLNANYSGGIMTFTWSDASFSLQSATNVLGPYNTIPGAASGFTTNPVSHPTIYFRLYRQ
jgi:hypothetical protein